MTSPMQQESAASELSRLGTACLAIANDWIRRGEDGARAVPWSDAREFRAAMDVSVPLHGVDEHSLLCTVKAILHNSVNPWTGRFLEKLYTAPAVVSILGELVLAVMNASVHVFSASPMLTIIEERCAAALCSLVGFEDTADGVTMPGGAASNTLGVQLALMHAAGGVYGRGGSMALVDKYTERGRRGRGARPAILASDHAHFSVSRAAVAAGLGANAVINIRTDAHGRMDVADLERVCREMHENTDDARGVPLIVIATSGTTVMGAFDDVEAIARVCKAYDCWLHVDASWGGAVAFLPQTSPHRQLVRGIGMAHSVTINPHKLLGVTHQCSFLLVRDRAMLTAPTQRHGTEDGYLFHDTHAADAPDMATKTLGCGRRGEALKLYLVWLRYGTHGLGEHMEHGLCMARDMLARLERIDALEVGPVAAPLFLQICVRPRHAPWAVRAMHAHLRASGHFAVDYAPLCGHEYIRLVVHPRTPWHVYEELIGTLSHAASRVASDRECK